MSTPVEQSATCARSVAEVTLDSHSLTFEQKMRAAQIDLVYRQGGPSLIAALMGVLFAVYVLYGSVPTVQLQIWALLSAVVYIGRLALVWSYRRASAATKLQRPWDHWYFIGTFFSALSWGAIGMFLLPDSVAHQAYIVLGINALCAGVAVSYAALRGVAQTFIITALAPYGVHLISLGTEIQIMMGAVVLMFMVVILVSSLMMHQAIVRTLRLGLEKEDLVRTLMRANQEAEFLNNDLRQEIEERSLAEQRIRTSRSELSRILDNIQDTYFRTDIQGKLLQVSPSVTELLGYSQHELIGDQLDAFFINSANVEHFKQALSEGQGSLHGYELRVVRKDGRRIWISLNAQYYRDDEGEVAGIEGTGHDISKLKQAEAELRAEKERVLVTLGSIGDGVIATDADGLIEYLNPVAEELTGWQAHAALGRPLAEVFHVIDEDTRQLAEDPVRACLRKHTAYMIPGHPILLSATNDIEYSVEVTVSPIKDDGDNIRGAVLVFHDVTELRGLAREMTYQASHDMLTGLVNRREFENRLELAVQSAVEEGQQHAMCYLDLDQFKVVNDTSGHLAGDELLRQLACQLQARIRESDTLARLGGDEFGVLLEACPLDKALEIAESLRSVVKAFRFEWEDHRFEMGVSIGLVAINKDTGGLAEVLSAADSACYVAKDEGRNRTHVFSPDDTALVQHHSHMRWVQRLQRALEQDSFALYCQSVTPIKSHPSNSMRYHEILLRMREQGHELIAPAVFVPAAERYHLMPSVDRWVVHHALQALASRSNWSTGDLFAINLSGQSLGDDSFLEYVQKELDAVGVPSERICFEITETAAVAKLRSAQRFITTLRKRGCLFALDDFGSGLSSFAYLKRLPVDFLKIDGRFVRDIVSDPVDHAMVESINQLGHVMGVRTIGESVENVDILARLEKLGVDYAQGYGIHQPEPLMAYIR